VRDGDLSWFYWVLEVVVVTFDLDEIPTIIL